MSNKDKFVLYLAGGGMSGVFGAGVVTSLQKLDVYERIESVYAASAGALDAAYFLTKNTAVGSSIYYEDLTKNFLNIKNVIPGAIQRLRKGPVFPDDPHSYINAMDIEYLFNVVENKKPLDVQKIISQPINFNVKVFNQTSGELKYLNCKCNDALKILKASCCLPPYTFEHVVLHGQRLVDSYSREVIGLDTLIKENPDTKIVVVVNRPIRNMALNKIATFIEALVTGWMHGPKYFEYPYLREHNFRKDFKEANNNENVLLIYPKGKHAWSKDTNKRILLRTYKLGQKAGLEILNFINS